MLTAGWLPLAARLMGAGGLVAAPGSAHTAAQAPPVWRCHACMRPAASSGSSPPVVRLCSKAAAAAEAAGVSPGRFSTAAVQEQAQRLKQVGSGMDRAVGCASVASGAASPA